MRGEDHRRKLKDSARMYEQILTRMPDDTFSLQALVDIYRELGDQKMISRYSQDLARVEAGEVPSAPQSVTAVAEPASARVQVSVTAPRVNRIRLGNRPSVNEPVLQAWKRSGPGDISSRELETALRDLEFTLLYSHKSQVDLMIKLLDVEVITQPQFEKVMYRLAEHTFSRKPERPMTAMHMLEQCPGADMETVRFFLSRKTQLPYIDIGLFKYRDRLARLLPRPLMFNHGIVIFKKIGPDYCVAVLNPLNIELMNKLAELLNGQVYFYVTAANEFDNFISRMAD